MTRFAVITGGSTGIGRHLVERFSAEGCKVAFSYIGRNDEAAALVDALGGSVLGLSCDVARSDAVDRFFDEATAWAGTAPDVLVNNAGIQTWSALLDLAEDDWDRVIATNLKGTFLNTRRAARAMIEAGKGGAIVNLGSGCNKLAFPRLVDYTASKGGIEQFTKVAAAELGPHGITVNCVAPGAILTERTRGEAGGYAGKWSALTPLRRVGTPEDVAGAVLFFASPAAAFVTGQTLWVDGGLFTQAPWPADY